jgi:hypothetical protein
MTLLPSVERVEACRDRATVETSSLHHQTPDGALTK